MKIKRWKRFAFAALLTAFTAFAYHSATVRACPRVVTRAQKPHADEVVLRGKGVVRLAGYELNLSFTPEGRFVSFDITATPKSKMPAAG